MAKTIITLGREYCTGGRCSIYIIDQTGTMQFAEVRLPTPPSAPEANQSTLPSAP